MKLFRENNYRLLGFHYFHKNLHLLKSTALMITPSTTYILITLLVLSAHILRYSGAHFPHSEWIRRDTDHLCVLPYAVQMRETANQNNFEYAHFSRTMYQASLLSANKHDYRFSVVIEKLNISVGWNQIGYKQF